MLDLPAHARDTLRRRNCMRLRHAFTVLELLLVILILSLSLVMIVGPIFQPSREKARRIQCLHNLKQLGAAGAAYAVDNDSRLPYGSISVFANVTPMSNYLSSTKLIVCPSGSKMPAPNFGDPRASDAANVSYTQHLVPFAGII